MSGLQIVGKLQKLYKTYPFLCLTNKKEDNDVHISPQFNEDSFKNR